MHSPTKAKKKQDKQQRSGIDGMTVEKTGNIAIKDKKKKNKNKKKGSLQKISSQEISKATKDNLKSDNTKTENEKKKTVPVAVNEKISDRDKNKEPNSKLHPENNTKSEKFKEKSKKTFDSRKNFESKKFDRKSKKIVISKNDIRSKKLDEEEGPKRTLTFRQLHKRKKQAEKRKAQRMKKKFGSDYTITETDNNTDKEPTTEKKEEGEKEKPEKIILPKSVHEATSNWRKLQMSLEKETDEKSLKRKRDPVHMRNPKYRKMDEKAINERIIKEVTKSKDNSTDIWFEDVDKIFIEEKTGDQTKTDVQTPPTEDTSPDNDQQLVKPEAFKGLTNVIGIDCEMVGIKDGHTSVLARVSIVNCYGEPVYDKFVKPAEKVTDYRTRVSGIRPEDLKKGEDFRKVRKEVADILKGRILVGHALKNDFKVLKLKHPVEDTRDSQKFSKFRTLCDSKLPALKKLTEKVLDVKIQHGEHSSIQDAQASIRLYTMHKAQWEAEVTKKGKIRKKKKKVVNSVKKGGQSEDKLDVIDRLWDV